MALSVWIWRQKQRPIKRSSLYNIMSVSVKLTVTGAKWETQVTVILCGWYVLHFYKAEVLYAGQKFWILNEAVLNVFLSSSGNFEAPISVVFIVVNAWSNSTEGAIYLPFSDLYKLAAF